MNIQDLLQVSIALAAMPPEEIKYISEKPELAEQDIKVYNACRRSGNLKAWEQLKAFRRKANFIS